MAKIMLVVCAGTTIFLTFAVCLMALIDQFRKSTTRRRVCFGQ
jgi:hypothetical protein